MIDLRFNAAVTRLEILSARIESRIAKMETASSTIGTAENRAKLATAKEKTAMAKSSVSELNSAIATAVQKGVFSTEEINGVKIKMQTAKTDLKKAREALVDVINSLKPGRNRSRNATTTDSD